jgi:type IV secretory pathway VirJ component
MRPPVVLFVVAVLCFSLLGSTCIAAQDNTAPLPDHAAVAELPLIELPVALAQSDILAIILSGDGGWADLDKSFGEAFQERGIATVGFDCLKYFWKTRQPAEFSKDIDAVVRYYLHAWDKKRVLLVGFSFGACWLPFLVNRLPGDILPRIPLCVLLSPSSFVNVEVHVMDWVGDDRRPGALEVLPEALRMQQSVLCVSGKEEDDTICPALNGATVKKLLMPGGHHYDYQYDPVIDAIFTTLKGVKKEGAE